MNHQTPLAYFITWTIYGVHLQGALTGWRRRREGEKPPQPLLEAWHAERLTHSIVLFNSCERVAVENACRSHSEYRSWKLWAINVRTNHVHVVVSASTHNGTVVRDQLKANCTRQLRVLNKLWGDRPVWAVGGDVQFIWTEEELSTVIDYTQIAQDRKGRDSLGQPHGVPVQRDLDKGG
jgi:REP element-mobilizing transposase RayT